MEIRMLKIMIKKILIIAVILGCAWWYWKARTTLSEDKVLAYYTHVGEVIVAREPEGLCKLLADDYQGTDSASLGEEASREHQFDKTQSCGTTRDLFAKYDELDKKFGGLLNLKYHYKVNNFKLSPDKKSATVDINYSLDTGGSFMQMNSHSKDTLIRKNGKTLLLRSNSETVISVGNRG